MSSFIVFMAFAITTAIDFIVAAAVIRRKDKDTRFLGYALIAGGLVSLFYVASVNAQSYQAMSVFSSLYFISVDLALLAFSIFLSMLTKVLQKKPSVILRGIAGTYFVFDAIILLANPFAGEFAISYIPVDASIGLYSYDAHLLYVLHLSYCYIMVAYCFMLLVLKAIKVPHLYKNRYVIYLVGFFLIVALNATYLFMPGAKMYDISILLYSFLGLYIYFVHFHYLKRTMVNQANSLVIEQLGQGIAQFDYEGHLVTINDRARLLIRESKRSILTLDDFINACGIRQKVGDAKSNVSFLWRSVNNGRLTSYHVDYRLMTDKSKSVIGSLFVIQDNSLEVDILTGFSTHASFLRTVNSGHFSIATPCVIAACDLERLASVNAIYGRATGDDALSLLARIMQSAFPQDTQFVRYPDATLIAIVPSISESEGHEYLNKIAARINSQTACPAELSVQSCLEVMPSSSCSILETIQKALVGLRSRKLLVESSSHSSLISSLAQMQRQGDGETEEHVQRTRDTGEMLGKRLGLSDAQINDFALLCLLHDIGKVGVPLEILNKPGRLTEVEWAIMRAHTTKGYNIARASEELSGIAEYILHHHENWDGSGYPDGLVHEAIPLLSRMVSVVDTFDAMTHNRPYRRAISIEDAKAELLRCAGTQFDPTIVAEFLAMIEENPDLVSSERDSTAPHLFDSLPTSQQAASNPAVVQNRAPHMPSHNVGENEPSLTMAQYAHYQLDDNQRIVEINDEFTHLTEYTQEDLEKYQLRQIDLIPLEDQEQYAMQVDIGLKRDHAVMIEHRVRTKSGLDLFVMCYGREYFDPINKKMRVEVIAANLQDTAMTNWLFKQEKIRSERTQQRWEDALRKDITGVLTRTAFRNDVQLLLMDKDSIVALMVLDVDYFKQYNDAKGHPQGDALLNKLAQLLIEACGADGLAGRFGGDEFALAKTFAKDTPSDEIRQTVETIWQQVNNGLEAYDKVHITLGAARSTDDTITLSALYAAADDALYEAKKSGRNCCRIHL